MAKLMTSVDTPQEYGARHRRQRTTFSSKGGSASCRQFEPERAAFRHARVDADSSALRFDREFAECQSESRRVVLPVTAALDGAELLEDFLSVRGGNTRAFVLDLETNAAVTCRNRDSHGAAWIRVFDGVADEVFDDAAGEGAVTGHVHRFRAFDLNLTRVVRGPKGRLNLLGHPGQIPRGSLDGHLALLQAAYVEQVVNHPLELFS